MEGQLAWWIAGPAMAACVLACRVLFNGRLGVTGGFSEIISKTGRGSLAFDWRGCFVVGVLLAGVLYVALRGGRAFEGYGWLTDTFHGAGQIAIGAILLVAGVAIGYGAKRAGGCTSGNGLSGTSMLSPASLAATATFFGTAIAVSFLIRAVV